MKTTMLPEHPDTKSPAGADVRFLMESKMGTMIHSTVPHIKSIKRLSTRRSANSGTCWMDTVRSGEIMAKRAVSLISFQAPQSIFQ